MTIIRISAGKCEACDKTLDESEMRIRGWNSGVELGLCRKCASFVNNPSLFYTDDEDCAGAHHADDDGGFIGNDINKLFD